MFETFFIIEENGKICEHCGKPIKDKSALREKRYCSEQCRNLHLRKKIYGNQIKVSSKSEKAMLSRLIAIMDLTNKGFSVFQHFSGPKHYDLVIEDSQGQLWKAKVMSALFNEKTGRIYCPEPKKMQADVLIKVVIFKDGSYKIFYKPEILTDQN